MRPINTILRRAWGALGPGLTTGAADDDPSGIATYSQAGAQFGFALPWTMVLTLPFMAAIQIISALIGWHTRRGSPPISRKRLPRPVLLLLVALLVDRQHDQYRRRSCRDGRGAAPRRRRPGDALRAGLRRGVPAGRDRSCRTTAMPAI